MKTVPNFCCILCLHLMQSCAHHFSRVRFFVWSTSCEHNFSWTFRRPIFLGRFLTPIFQRVFDHRFFGLISCVKILFFSRSRSIETPKFRIFWCSELPPKIYADSQAYLVIPVQGNTPFPKPELPDNTLLCINFGW